MPYPAGTLLILPWSVTVLGLVFCAMALAHRGRLSLLGRLLRRARNEIIWRHLRILRHLFRGRPVPLSYWSLYRDILGMITRTPSNAIFPSADSRCSIGEVAVPELCDLLSNDELGYWSLDAETILFLWNILHRASPKIILEYGSGISTIVLARYALLASSTGQECFIVSLEQDLEAKKATEDRLRRLGLDCFVQLWHIPADRITGYDRSVLSTSLTPILQTPVDFVLIDGPAGEPGCRLQTLPMLAPYIRNGTLWVMDDAFRDGELSILQRWTKHETIVVTGVYPIGKGLAAGMARIHPARDGPAPH
jgi:predicted O-methyltransferase YrrM